MPPDVGPVVPGVMSPGVLLPVVVVPGSALVVPPRGAIELVPGLFRDGNAPNGLYAGDPGFPGNAPGLCAPTAPGPSRPGFVWGNGVIGDGGGSIVAASKSGNFITSSHARYDGHLAYKIGLHVIQSGAYLLSRKELILSISPACRSK